MEQRSRQKEWFETSGILESVRLEQHMEAIRMNRKVGRRICGSLPLKEQLILRRESKE
jgi:hypothetical protein